MRIDIYVTLAELSLGLVGFAALVGIFSSSLDKQREHESIALRMLVEISLTAFLLSLVAIILDGFIDDSKRLWRVCSGFAVVVVGGHILATVTRLPIRTQPIRFRYMSYPTVPFAMVFVVLNALNCGGQLTRITDAPFRAAIAIQLMVASFFFFVRFFVTGDDD